MPKNVATITIQDYDREKSHAELSIGPLTALNFDAKLAAVDDYRSALGGITVGKIRKVQVTDEFTEDTDPVTDKTAQREIKWLVEYKDVTQFLDVANTINNVGFGNTYRVEIPTAKLSLLSGGSEFLDLTVTAVATYVTAFEAVQNSPTGGNETQVISIRNVGRNL